MAADALRVVIKQQPDDAMAKRLLEAIQPQPLDETGATPRPQSGSTPQEAYDFAIVGAPAGTKPIAFQRRTK